ncbi:hypothetical protein ACP6EK_08355 [Candidatus Caldatribacterium sp. SIUC1]|uniref:hypothetical protein n=1 Tax=Candidatus Caldatribacterium sp. SIUC1 TaxID=3418365 RepID=UPI003F68EE65
MGIRVPEDFGIFSPLPGGEDGFPGGCREALGREYHLTLFGDVASRRTCYRKKKTREYRYLLDDQVGLALVLERATELSYQRAILPQNKECTVSSEVVKQLVHNKRTGRPLQVPLRKLGRNPECQKLPGCSQCRGPWKPTLSAQLSYHPMALETLKFNGAQCGVTF